MQIIENNAQTEGEDIMRKFILPPTRPGDENPYIRERYELACNIFSKSNPIPPNLLFPLYESKLDDVSLKSINSSYLIIKGGDIKSQHNHKKFTKTHKKRKQSENKFS
jgi:hypothetical protein